MTYAKELQTIEKRASKSLFWTTLLTLIVSPIGYIYTARYVAALISTVILFLIFATTTNTNTTTTESDELGGLLIVFLITVVIENFRSVRSARQINNYIQSIVKPNDTELKILKLLKSTKQEGVTEGVTIAEIILATELPSQTVQELMNKLEENQLVRVGYREEDNVITYTIT